MLNNVKILKSLYNPNHQKTQWSIRVTTPQSPNSLSIKNINNGKQETIFIFPMLSTLPQINNKKGQIII
jgi:hypothetical protein